MPIAPKTTAEELEAELRSLVLHSSHYVEYDFALRGLEKRIRSLMNIEPAHAHMLLGTLYQLMGRFEHMREEHRIAKSLSSRAAFYANYAAGLVNTGFFSDAQKELQVAGDPTNGIFLFSLPRLLSSGAVSTAFQYLEQAEKQKLVEEVPPLLGRKVRDAYRVLRSRNLSDELIAQTLDLFGEAMRSHKTLFWGEGPILTVWPDDENAETEAHLEYTFNFVQSPDFVLSLESEFVDSIISRAPGHLPPGLTVTATCVNANAKIAA